MFLAVPITWRVIAPVIVPLLPVSLFRHSSHVPLSDAPSVVFLSRRCERF